MPEIRKDPVLKRWVIIATERSRRPSEFMTEPEPIVGQSCVFCEGREADTPPETLAVRARGMQTDGPGWTVRAFSNKFPALSPGPNKTVLDDGLYTASNGSGAHEVVVETPDHRRTFEELSAEEMAEVLRVWRERYRALCNRPEHAHVLVFKNAGKDAGASLEHAHSQIIASPVVPALVLDQMEGAKDYYQETGRCVYCSMLDRESGRDERRIVENETFVAFAPYAACFPFQTLIVPKRHDSDFSGVTEEQLKGLAQVLSRTLKALAGLLGTPAYNLVLHTSPCRSRTEESYHWHLEVVPRLTKIAGFEWGSGCYINPTPPEDAALAMREQIEISDF